MLAELSWIISPAEMANIPANTRPHFKGGVECDGCQEGQGLCRRGNLQIRSSRKTMTEPTKIGGEAVGRFREAG